MSLRARLALGAAATLALAICAGLAAAYFVVAGQLRGEVDNALRERAAGLVAFSRDAPVPSRPSRLQVKRPKLGGAAGYVQFVGTSGATSRLPGERTRLLTEGVRAVAAGERKAFYQIARPLTEIDNSLGRIRILFLLISAATVAAAAAVAWAVAGSALRPVRRLTRHAEEIAASGSLHARTDERRSDELGRLAAAFNRMLDALARSVSSQKQLVADASHELRTPLAAARANVQLIELHEQLPRAERRTIVSAALVELRELSRLTEQLVALARADGLMSEKETLRLDVLVEESVAAVARRSPIEFRLDLEPTEITAAREPLAQAVANLLDNAVKWSPGSATIDVRVKGGSVSVRDRGPGIDATDLPHIFDRFYRAAKARKLPGSGLGLAIVRQVAEAHGGTITAQAAPGGGGGTLFTLTLPTPDGYASEREPDRTERFRATAGGTVVA